MLKTTDRECRLQLGEFCCALRFPTADADYVTTVKQYFNGFLSENNPDIVVYVDIVLHSEEIQVPTSLCESKEVHGNSFNYHAGLISGQLDLQNKKCAIQVKRVLLGNPTVRIFEQFFHQLYFTLLENKYGSGNYNSMMVHSCGVLKNGRGYVFTGPSGIGKSTIARLSTDYDVLNDEMCFITDSNGRCLIKSTPFNGFFEQKKNMSGVLNCIFFLKQDKKNYIKKIKLSDCIVDLAREIVPPISLLHADKKSPLSMMIDMAAKILAKVPFYEFHFLPEKNMWKCIEEFEQKCFFE